MAPRQKRRIEFDEDKFVSARAATKYSSIITFKKCIQDRVFDKPGGDLDRVITERGWQDFCGRTNKAAVEVVKEFYANALFGNDSTVFVRGFFVDFTADRINSFYELRDIPLCEYENFGTEEGPLNEVVNFLTDGKGTWKVKQGVKVNFPASMLNATSKAWHYFISSTLLPTYHHSEVSKDRAVLNFCIQNNKEIDVGEIIFKNIMNTARSESSGGLGHPGLIYALCQLSGVEAEEREEWVQPMKPISKANLKTYASHEGWRSGTRSSSTPSTSRDVPSTSYEPATSGSPTLSDLMEHLTLQTRSLEATLVDRLGSMEQRIDDSIGFLKRRNDAQFSELGRRHDHYEEYLRRHSDFSAAYYAAEARRRGGESSAPYPTFPEYPAYQPSLPEDPEALDSSFFDFNLDKM